MTKDFDAIYEQVCGLREETGKYVNEFKKGGLCTQLSQDAYAARTRLDTRLNCFEDEDVLQIVNASEDMQRIVAYKLWQYAQQED